MKLPDQVWHLKGAEPGPAVMILGGVHGDESSGLHLVRSLLTQFGLDHEAPGVTPSPTVRGDLYLGFGNPEAIAIGARGTAPGRDLNRVFRREMLEAPEHAADPPELRRARELAPLFEELDALLDLHGTSSPSPPFVGQGADDPGQRRLYAPLEVQYVLSDPHHRLAGDSTHEGPGTTDGWVRAHGGSGLCYETGWDQADDYEHALDSVLRFLGEMGSLPPLAHRELPAKEIYEIFRRLSVERVEAFEFAPGMAKGWHTVEPGQLVGTHADGTEIHVPEDCPDHAMYLFPRDPSRPRALGDPLYYLAIPAPESVYYADYLGLDRLLDAQHPRSEALGVHAHDELLFIITHQTYELWFKQILHEVGPVQRLMSGENISGRDLAVSVTHLQRVLQIQKLIVQQLDVLETMQPLDFLDFRGLLGNASGFQSLQFRLLENTLGLRSHDRCTYTGADYKLPLNPEDRARAGAAEAGSSLFDLVNTWLARTPFLEFEDFDFWAAYRAAVATMLDAERDAIRRNPTLNVPRREAELAQHNRVRDNFGGLFDQTAHDAMVARGERRFGYKAFQAALLINLYRDEPMLHLPFQLLRALMDIDDQLTMWRHRHAMMVMRVIGAKIGTGGSSGHSYLRETAVRHRVFGDLFSLATYYIPRSHLPELPTHLRDALDFKFR